MVTTPSNVSAGTGYITFRAIKAQLTLLLALPFGDGQHMGTWGNLGNLHW